MLVGNIFSLRFAKRKCRKFCDFLISQIILLVRINRTQSNAIERLKFDCQTQSNLNRILPRFSDSIEIRLRFDCFRLVRLRFNCVRLRSIEIRLRLTTISHFVLKGDRNNRNAFTAADMRGSSGAAEPPFLCREEKRRFTSPDKHNLERNFYKN